MPENHNQNNNNNHQGYNNQRGNNNYLTVSTPYNFVPLNKFVYIPSWGKQISQDIPFKDGQDGIIQFEMTNLTPLFTRDGHTAGKKKGREDPDPAYSAHIDTDKGKLYYIPATSIKGMLRSVLEILSFSKLGTCGDERFGYRPDFRPNEHIEDDTRCGWLFKLDGKDKYKIYDCGTPISIDTQGVTRFFNHQLPYNPEDDASVRRQKIKQIWKTRYPTINGCRLICSGPKVGNNIDFLFPDEIIHTYDIDKRVFDDFETAYKESPYYYSDTNNDKDKNTAFDLLKSGRYKEEGDRGIPVFFKLEDGEVISIGLTQVYRCARKYGISKGVIQHLTDRNIADDSVLDMAQCIFGHIGDDAIRGRVSFGNAFASEIIADGDLINEEGVLGSPRASFYPFYIKQSRENQHYKTYDAQDFEIAGRKRYRIHSHAHNLPIGNENEDVRTFFLALKKGYTFNAEIRFHNLKPEEIGALLSTITFHGFDKAYHSIGLAKPMGFGKIASITPSLSIYSDNSFKQQDIYNYMYEFEKKMNEFISHCPNRDNNWLNSEQVKRLMAIASEHPDDEMPYDKLNYMEPTDYNRVKNDRRDNHNIISVLNALEESHNITIPSIENMIVDFSKAEMYAAKGQLRQAINEYERILLDHPEQEKFITAILVDLRAKLAIDIGTAQGAEDQKKRERVEGGIIKYLEETNLNGGYLVHDFDSAYRAINKCIKESREEGIQIGQAEIIREIAQITSCLDRVYSSLNNREKKQLANRDSGIWRNFETLLGKETTDNLFNHINNHE